MKLAVNKTKYDIKVKVQFDINGGTSISETEKFYVLGQKYDSLPTATKTGGYILTGWFTDPTNGTKITTDSVVDYNITKLYAHYALMTNYTAFNVTTTSSYKDYGFYSLTKKSSSNSVFIDWGDGSIEELTSYSQVYHTYASVGNFIVKVSDDITQFCMSNSSTTYYEKVRYTFKSIASWSTSLSNSLPAYCFCYCSAMNSLQNLGSITSIGTYCFYYCTSLTSFTGLGNITSLPNYAFYYCSGISSLSTLPTSVTSYGQYCLANTSISDLSKVRSTDYLNAYCFAYMNSLRNLSTLAPRSSLPANCFFYCQNLNTVDLTTWTSLTSIPSYCFQYCYYLNSVKLPSSITTINSYAFHGCYYGQLVVDFSNTQITSLPYQCFGYCYSLKEVKLPNTLRSISDYAFYYCYNSYFKEISLPSALTSIGSYAFYYCRYLASISCYAENAPTVQSTTFGSSTTYYTGRMSYSAGTNILYVNNPNNYNTSYWSSVLLDSTKCGYHTQPMNPYDVTFGRMEGLSSWYLSTGTEIVPEVSVYSSNGTLLTENVAWSKVLSNNIEVGIAGISAVGISPYYGCLEKTFRIVGEEPHEYVQSNLVTMWDGENNNGQGSHSDSITTWKNLGSTGSTYDATRSIVNWGSNYAIFNGTSAPYFTTASGGLLGNYLKGEFTIEVIFSPDSNWKSNYSGLFGDHSNGLGLVFGQYESGTIQFSQYAPSNSFWAASSSNFTIGNIYSVVMTASATNQIKKCYCNNILKNSGSTIASAVTFTNSNAIQIGAAYYGNVSPQRSFYGKIFCVRCYDRMLTDDELTQNFNLDQQRFFNDYTI